MNGPKLPRGFPGFYAWLTLFATTLISLILGMVVTFTLADRQVKAERAAREQQQADQRAQGAAALKVTCALITAQDGVYRDTPPISAAGRNAAKAWHDLSVQFGCT